MFIGVSATMISTYFAAFKFWSESSRSAKANIVLNWLTLSPYTQHIHATIDNQSTSLYSHVVDEICSVWLRYNASNFLHFPHTRHPITCPWRDFAIRCLWHSVLTSTTAIACYIGQCYKAILLYLNELNRIIMALPTHGLVADEFRSRRPVTRSFVVLFDLRLNKRLNKQPRRWCLRRNHAHYGVIVMLEALKVVHCLRSCTCLRVVQDLQPMDNSTYIWSPQCTGSCS